MAFLEFNGKIPTKKQISDLVNSMGNPPSKTINDLSLQMSIMDQQNKMGDFGGVSIFANTGRNRTTDMYQVGYSLCCLDEAKENAKKAIEDKFNELDSNMTFSSISIDSLNYSEYKLDQTDKNRFNELKEQFKEAQTEFEDLKLEEIKNNVQKSIDNANSEKQIKDLTDSSVIPRDLMEKVDIIYKKVELIKSDMYSKSTLEDIEKTLKELDKDAPKEVKEKCDKILKEAEKSKKTITEYKNEAFKDGKTPDEIKELYDFQSELSSNLSTLLSDAGYAINAAKNTKAINAIRPLINDPSGKSKDNFEGYVDELQKIYDSIPADKSDKIYREEPETTEDYLNTTEYRINFINSQAKDKVEDYLDDAKDNLKYAKDTLDKITSGYASNPDELAENLKNLKEGIKSDKEDIAKIMKRYKRDLADNDGTINMEFQNKNFTKDQKTIAGDNFKKSLYYLDGLKEGDISLGAYWYEKLDNSRIKINVTDSGTANTKIYYDKSDRLGKSSINIPSDILLDTTPQGQVKLAAIVVHEMTHAQDIFEWGGTIGTASETSWREETDAAMKAVSVIRNACDSNGEKIFKTPEEQYKAFLSIVDIDISQQDYENLDSFKLFEIIRLKYPNLPKTSDGHFSDEDYELPEGVQIK